MGAWGCDAALGFIGSGVETFGCESVRIRNGKCDCLPSRGFLTCTTLMWLPRGIFGLIESYKVIIGHVNQFGSVRLLNPESKIKPNQSVFFFRFFCSIFFYYRFFFVWFRFLIRVGSILIFEHPYFKPLPCM